jgi:hypothetical protein
VWQLHSGRLAHLQEGVFLPPPLAVKPEELHRPTAPTVHQRSQAAADNAADSPSSPPSSRDSRLLRPQLVPAVQLMTQRNSNTRCNAVVVATATAPAEEGLGAEARAFLEQHLPLFAVPWSVGAQLEAANVRGVRVAGPLVLRLLLQRLGQRVQAQGERHPFDALTTTQALQLLLYCCSDLRSGPGAVNRGGSNADHDNNGSGRDGGGDSGGGVGSGGGRPGHADAAAAAAAATPSTARSPSGLDAQDAAAGTPGQRQQQPRGNAIDDGMAFLRTRGMGVVLGLADQLHQGVDGVLRAVADATAADGGGGGGGSGGGGARRIGGATAVQQAVAAGPPGGGAPAAGESHSSGSSSGIDLARAGWLAGLPIPTADGRVAVLGKAPLLVVPPGCCSPHPASLLPPHLRCSFVAPDCVAALAWLLQDRGVRLQLQLRYYGPACIAEHLSTALGVIWEGGAPPSSTQRHPRHVPAPRSAAAAATATATAARRPPAALPPAVPWHDGAAGGPLPDWLQALWRVLLHVMAAAQDWSEAECSMAPPMSAPSGSGSSGTTAEAAAVAAAADAAWAPLDDWPLIPLADGRLLRLRHRRLVLAPMQDYAMSTAAAAPDAQAGAVSWPPAPQAGCDGANGVGAAASQGAADTAAAAAAAHSITQPLLLLAPPWDWLVPAFTGVGLPLLDARFAWLVVLGGGPHSLLNNAANTATQPADEADTHASAAPMLLPAPVPVELLFGPQPLIGRPPFLGPLLRKLCGAETQLAAPPPVSVATWDVELKEKVFGLLADNPPRDLDAPEVQWLRRLPIFRRLALPAVATGGAAGVTAAPPELCALDGPGCSVDWLLTPAAVAEECAGE